MAEENVIGKAAYIQNFDPATLDNFRAAEKGEEE
jgi:hypothetical protein